MKQLSYLYGEVKPPIAVAYGMGVDSTALLCGMAKQGIRPDFILFADTGAERKETYSFEPIMQEWLKKEGFPPITTVRYVPKDFKNWPPYYDLETNLLTNGTLPGVSFGPASCSQKHKQMPQHSFLKNCQPVQEAWRNGERCLKLIGFDNSPRDRKRTYSANPKDRHLYDYHTPLIAWNWDRTECSRQIKAAGLPVPGKSSCFFCIALKTWELEALPEDYLKRIVRIEARAHPRLKTVEGLWRSTVKGTRGAVPRPGSMTKYIREKRLLPEDIIDEIWESTPKEIISFQEGYLQAKKEGNLEHFLSTAKDYRTEYSIRTFCYSFNVDCALKEVA